MEIEKINIEINKIIKKISNEFIKKNEKELKKNITDVINFSQEEIKNFAENNIQEQFKNFYGINFSSDILQKLYSISVKNFHPEISYTNEDINIFKANLDINSLLDDMDNFISDMDGLSEEEYYDDDLYNEYYGDEGNIEEEFDYNSNFKQKINWKYTYYNKKFRDGKIPKIENAFKTAKENTLKNFDIIEKPKLKTYSKKKIGINIF